MNEQQTVSTARRSAVVTLRRASANRGADYARRVVQRDNVDDVTQATLAEAWRMAAGIGDAWRQGQQVALPSGMTLESAAWLAAWALDADAVTLATVMHRAYGRHGRYWWRRAYGVARIVIADRDGRVSARALAYASRRVGRIAPESGAPASRQRVPADWERVTLGAPTTADADAGAASVAYAYERLAADGTTVQAVTHYADAGAGNRYVARAEYVRWDVSDADADWTRAVDALADAVAADPGLRRACRALVAAEGLAGLVGRVLPADAPEATVTLMSV